MKLLSNILKNMSWMPRCDPEKIILEVNNIPLAEAVLASTIVCPICASDLGGFFSAADKGWICRPCFGSGAVLPKGGKISAAQSEVVNVKALVELDTEHVLANLKQPSDIIEWSSKWVLSPTGFVLMSGTNGTGKTFLAKTLCNLAQVNQKKFCVLSELNIDWKDQIEKWHSDTYMLNQMTEHELLVLDDVGAIRTPTDAFLDFMYALIDRRYRMNKPTIITTNLNHNDLRLKFGDAIASRITSGKILKMDGSDRRRNKF